MKMRASKFAVYVVVTIVAATTLLVVAARNHLHAVASLERQSSLAAGARGVAGAAAANHNWAQAYGELPLSFTENAGQTDPQVRFISSGSGYQLFLTSQEAVLTMQHPRKGFRSPLERALDLRAQMKARAAEQAAVVRLHLDGANPRTEVVGFDRLPGRTDYFIGSDPRAWRTGVASYSHVKYHEVYPGVDLVFYGNRQRLEYDFTVARGADPKLITFDVEGARSLRITSQGNLAMSVPDGEVELQKPVAYQNVDGTKRNIEVAYTLTGPRHVGFRLAPYDTSEPLIIDPVLDYSTYLGGSGDDAAFGIAVDVAGDAFVAGQTFSTDFPTTAGGFQQAPQAAASTNGAVFVTELNPTGTAEVYSSYLIGSDALGEAAFGIALDPTGNIYVAGQTSSTGFPTTTNAFKQAPGPGTPTAFVSKINPLAAVPANSLVYSTYLGGTVLDFANSIAADATGNVYVTGVTMSGDFPQMNGLTPPADVASGTAFLTRIDTTQSGAAGLIYSTYLGGDGKNAANLGLGLADGGFGAALDALADHNAFITGVTSSSNFPTAGNAFQTGLKAGNTVSAAFVTRIDTTKSGVASLIYSTYLAGSNPAVNVGDSGLAIGLDATNSVAYVNGKASSTDFPTTTGAFSSIGSNLGLAFASLIDTNVTAPASSLTYSTLISQLGPGTGGDIGLGIQADVSGNAFLTGGAGSTNFPVTKGAFQPTLAPGASGDGFVTKINPGGNGTADLIYSTYFGGSGSAGGPDVGNAIAIDSTGNAYITGQTFSSTAAHFPITSGAFQTALDGTSDAFVAKLPLIPTISVLPSVLNFGTVQIGTTSAAQTVTLTNNTATSVAVASVSVTDITPPSPATDFAKSADTCTGTNVAAGGNCTVSASFTPSLNGAESATLVFTDSDSSSPQNVSLLGTGSATPPDFTLTGPASITIKDGQSGNFNVTVTSVGGFNSAVDLACSGEPKHSTCTVQSPVTPTPAGVTATVTVTTNVKNAMGLPAPSVSGRQVTMVLFVFSLALVLPLVRKRGARLALAGLALCVLAAGCGGPRTPKGNSTLTITGTSGNLNHMITVTLTVD